MGLAKRKLVQLFLLHAKNQSNSLPPKLDGTYRYFTALQGLQNLEQPEVSAADLFRMVFGDEDASTAKATASSKSGMLRTTTTSTTASEGRVSVNLIDCCCRHACLVDWLSRSTQQQQQQQPKRQAPVVDEEDVGPTAAEGAVAAVYERQMERLARIQRRGGGGDGSQRRQVRLMYLSAACPCDRPPTFVSLDSRCFFASSTAHSSCATLSRSDDRDILQRERDPPPPITMDDTVCSCFFSCSRSWVRSAACVTICMTLFARISMR